MQEQPDLLAGVDIEALVREYEPVLRFTAGEMFFPMPADRYVAEASLWLAAPGEKQPVQLAEHGELTLDSLARKACEHPGKLLFMRYAPRSLQRKELRAWRQRPEHPGFSGVSRLAAVGLLGRVIDSGMRLSLTLRGKVPGGLAAAAQIRYSAAVPAIDAYHAHVSTDAGFVVIQYWFLYAMNDWRSSFSGVNDHESDWEQVTVFLAPQRNSRFALSWLAFSSHDETGDELRRRPDDPDIEWADGTHPVVNVGAGSHSGAYLPGDYLVRVQPPGLASLFGVVNRVRNLLFPWTRGGPSAGLGIPYVDYRRGDGIQIGPGTSRPWAPPVLIGPDTPWVRDFRGLWGLDTADPFGGERAPAGPRYERAGTIRMSWGDPAAWAGLDKIPPTPGAAIGAAAARVGELEQLIDDLSNTIASGQKELRQAAAGASVLPVAASKRDGTTMAAVRAGEEDLAALRARRREAISERDQLAHVVAPEPSPHAHLKHRAVPDTRVEPGLLVRFWSGASLSVLFVLLGLALLLRWGPVLTVCVAAVVIVMAVESLLRGRLLLFLLGLAILAAAGTLTWLFITHLRIAFGVLALIAAVAVGIANLRNLMSRG